MSGLLHTAHLASAPRCTTRRGWLARATSATQLAEAAESDSSARSRRVARNWRRLAAGYLAEAGKARK